MTSKFPGRDLGSVGLPSRSSRRSSQDGMEVRRALDDPQPRRYVDGSRVLCEVASSGFTGLGDHRAALRNSFARSAPACVEAVPMSRVRTGIPRTREDPRTRQTHRMRLSQLRQLAPPRPPPMQLNYPHPASVAGPRARRSPKSRISSSVDAYWLLDASSPSFLSRRQLSSGHHAPRTGGRSSQRPAARGRVAGHARRWQRASLATNPRWLPAASRAWDRSARSSRPRIQQPSPSGTPDQDEPV